MNSRHEPGNLKSLAKAAGIRNLRHLAELLGRSHSTVAHWSCGTHAVPPEVITILRLLAAGKITMDDVRSNGTLS